MLLRLAKNTLSLMTAGMIDKFAYALLFAILARSLSQSEFGAFNLVLTLIFLGGLLSNFGMDNVLIREVAKNRQQAKQIFSTALLITSSLALLGWPCMAALSIIMRYDSQVVRIISNWGIVFVFIAFWQISAAILKAYERMEIFALVDLFRSLLGLGLCLLVLYAGGSLAQLVVTLILVEGLKAAILTYVVHRHFAKLSFTFHTAFIVRLLKQSVPFALLLLCSVLLNYADILLMGWLKPLEDVGVYGAVSKFSDLLMVLSTSMVISLYPPLSAMFAVSHENSWRLYNESISVFAILGFGVAFGTLFLARPIICFIFGPTYAVGAAALRWLGWSFLFSIFNIHAVFLIFASGRRMYHVLLLGLLVVASNIIHNLFLIPSFSYNGAAIAKFSSTTLGFSGALILLRSCFGKLPNYFKYIWRPMLSGVVMLLCLNIFGDANVFLLLIIGTIIYLMGLFLLGEFRQPRYYAIKENLRSLFKASQDH